MILTFLLGLGSALAMHGYYLSLDGKNVGDTNQQQMAVRYADLVDSLFVYSGNIALTSGIGYGYFDSAP